MKKELKIVGSRAQRTLNIPSFIWRDLELEVKDTVIVEYDPKKKEFTVRMKEVK
jgi:hypothetical protein